MCVVYCVCMFCILSECYCIFLYFVICALCILQTMWTLFTYIVSVLCLVVCIYTHLLYPMRIVWTLYLVSFPVVAYHFVCIRSYVFRVNVLFWENYAVWVLYHVLCVTCFVWMFCFKIITCLCCMHRVLRVPCLCGRFDLRELCVCALCVMPYVCRVMC